MRSSSVFSDSPGQNQCTGLIPQLPSPAAPPAPSFWHCIVAVKGREKQLVLLGFTRAAHAQSLSSFRVRHVSTMLGKSQLLQLLEQECLHRLALV